jgi:hypothetical protein
MVVLRWLLLIPAAVAAWYAALVLGVLTHQAIDDHLCPPEDVVSGECVNPVILQVLEVTIHVFAAVSAVAVICASVLVAPRHKRAVAWLCLVLGTPIAGYMGAITHEWTLFASAVGGGCFTLAIVLRRLQQRERSATS